MVEVLVTGEFEAWVASLDARDRKAVARSIGLLGQYGVTLPFPHSSAISGAKHVRELRVQSAGKPLRCFYAFDPKRRAVVLVGGDKSGDKRFYEVMVPKADRMFEQHLAALED